MTTKKDILKKYIGKGGIVGDTIREIPGTVVRGIKGIGSGIKKGIQWAGGQIEKDMRMQDNTANKVKDAMQAERSGEYMPKLGKPAILKNVVKKSLPKAITPANFPTTSKKNSSGEIINPTKKDVSSFNSKFTTYKPK